MADTPASPASMDESDVARRVLASETLFREITAWTTGIPWLVLKRWREFEPDAKLARSYSYTQGVFLQLLWKDGGVGYLQLAVEASWGPAAQRFSWSGFVSGAIRAADTNAVEFVLRKRLLTLDDDQKTALWRSALTASPGSIAVLELLLTHVPPLSTGEVVADEAWKAWMEDHLLTPERAREMRTKNLAYTQLLVEKLGASCLPEGLIGVEAERDNMPLVKYLHTLPGQKVRSEVLRGVYMGLHMDARRSYTRFTNFRPDTQPALYDMLLFLLQHRREASTVWLEEYAFKCGDVLVLKVIECARGELVLTTEYEFSTFPLNFNVELLDYLSYRVPFQYKASTVVVAAAEGNWDLISSSVGKELIIRAEGVEYAAHNSHWDVVEEILDDGRELVFSPSVMDYAARDGRVDIVIRLHETRSEGCTSSALDWAAAHGHVDVFRFLHDKQGQTGTSQATDLAVKNRRSAMIQLLLESNLPKLCSSAAMDHAAANGDLAMVAYLHENRQEGCTTDAIDLAASNGHTDVVKFLLKNRTEGFTIKAVEGAMHRGYGKSGEWNDWREDLRDVPRATPHFRIGDRRHIQVLELLYANHPEVFTVSDMKSLLVCGAFDIWLKLKGKYPDHGGEDEAMAEAGARGFLSTIRFLVDVQGRMDLLHVALSAAVIKSPRWFGVLRQLYPSVVPSWNGTRGPLLDDSKTYWYSEDELKRFVCLSPEPFKYFEALDVKAPQIVSRLYQWTPSEEEIAAAQDSAKAAAAAAFYVEESVPDWMIEQDLYDAELLAREIKSEVKDEFGRELTWPVWAVYRHDVKALEAILRLAQLPKYASDPKFSFAGARSRAIRIGRLDILQWLLEHVQHVPVESTLLDDAIYYNEDVDIASWLAEHCPSGCTEFGRRRPWAIPPIQCGLNDFTLDRIEQSEKLRALVDFGALAAYAAEEGNVGLLKRLHDTYSDAFMARKDLVDRAVQASADAADFVTVSTLVSKRLRLKEGSESAVRVAHEEADRFEAAGDAARRRSATMPVLRYLQEIGYRHVSTIAMDSVRRDDRLQVLYFLYEHFSHGGYTMQAILGPPDRGHTIGNDNIIRLHLRYHGHADDHGAWDEAMTAAYTQVDWIIDRRGPPPKRMWEDFSHYGRFLHTNGWKAPLPRECRAGGFFYKRIMDKRKKEAEAKQEQSPSSSSV